MAYSDTLIPIEQAVTRFLFAYKKSTDDAPLYVEHAANCFQEFNLYDGNIASYQKYTLDATNKWLDMPDDMQGFVDLMTPFRGSWWPASQKDQIVNTTTTVGGVETRDSNQGEGVTIDQPRVTGYGSKGAWNKIRYKLDWETRRIYIDEAVTDYLVLFYVSSGIKVGATTEVPTFLIPMINAYLLWKESFWVPGLAPERESRKADYWREKLNVRNFINSMSLSQWQDVIYGSLTQSPQR